MYGILRCREPARVRTCFLASAFSLTFFVIIYVFSTSLWTKSDHLSRLQATIHPNIWLEEDNINSKDYRNRSKILPPAVVTIIHRIPEVKMHKYLNIFNASEESEEDRNSINTNQCVPLETTPEPTPICIYDPKIDVWVSGSIVKQGAWEKGLTYLMAAILTANPDMQLLDIGSNIGVFALQAAKMGRKVIAVDANKLNLRLLSKSLYLGGLQKYVTLVWNAVTDVHETIKLTITTGNIGGSYVKSEGEFDFQAKTKFAVETALSITLEDLIGLVKKSPIFMKIDIEGSEWKAFRGGEIFLQEVNVKYILMEWILYKKGYNGYEFAMHMAKFGFQPYEPKRTLIQLHIVNWESWPGDVLWIRV